MSTNDTPEDDARTLTVKEWMSLVSDQIGTLDAMIERKLTDFGKRIEKLEDQSRSTDSHAATLAAQRDGLAAETVWLRQELGSVLGRVGKLNEPTQQFDSYGNRIYR